MNGAWPDAATAIENIKKLEKFNVAWIEQPVHPGDFHSLKQIRDTGLTTIVADESMHTLRDCSILCELDAVDMVNISLTKCGGFCQALQIAEYCTMQGMPYIIGSNLNTQIGMAANTHFASITDNGGTDINTVHLIKKDIAFGLVTDQYRVIVPEKPGLGVELYKG